MSHRKEQVESTLKRAVSRALSRFVSDPRIVGMVSVTRVNVTADKRHAHVYVSVIPDKYQKRTIDGLTHAAKHISAKVCQAVSMRAVPRLEFRLDESLKKQDAVFDAIQRGIDRDQQDLVRGAEDGTDTRTSTEAPVVEPIREDRLR